jgi:hypothetical protein
MCGATTSMYVREQTGARKGSEYLKLTYTLTLSCLCCHGLRWAPSPPAAPCQSGIFDVFASLASNAGSNGIMFEVKNNLTTPIRMDAFDQAFQNAGSRAMEIYTLSGSCDGKMGDASAWRLVGSASVVVAAAFPTLLPCLYRLVSSSRGVMCSPSTLPPQTTKTQL